MAAGMYPDFDGQEVGCHRYAGHDPEIQVRVGLENCDHVPDHVLRTVRRNVFVDLKSCDFLPPEEPNFLRNSSRASMTFAECSLGLYPEPVARLSRSISPSWWIGSTWPDSEQGRKAGMRCRRHS